MDATRCVVDVITQFNQLADIDEFSSTFSFDAREGKSLPPYGDEVARFNTDWFDRDHVQGFSRLPGSADRYVFTHDAESDDQGEAGVMISDRSRAALSL